MVDLNVIKEIAKDRGLTIEEFAEKVGVTKQAIYKAMKNQTISVDTLESINRVFGIPVAFWFDEVATQQPTPTKPHIDEVAAIAGYRGGVADSVSWHTVVYKPIIVGMPEYDLTMRVTGDSMYPYLCSGDLIALREVRSGYFKPGEIYVVSTDEDAFVKRVFRSSEEGMAIRCESINPNFPPFDLPGDSVIKMYRVVGMQRVI